MIQKNRILNLWNLTASPPPTAIMTQSLRVEGFTKNGGPVSLPFSGESFEH
jgi:hypothetical protein